MYKVLRTSGPMTENPKRKNRIFHELGPDKRMHLTAEAAPPVFSTASSIMMLCGMKRKHNDPSFTFDSWSWLEDTMESLRPKDNHCHECVNAVKALELIEE